MKARRMHRTAQVLSLTGVALGLIAAINSALNADWTTATWALSAAMWAAALLIHRCPRPAAPERGNVGITFHGGPLDGADVPMPPIQLPEMLGAELEVSGTTYTVTEVEHTCYSAEARR